jgi:hypothetical protein
MVSLQMNPRMSKMLKDWARTNLYNMHLTSYIADASSNLELVNKTQVNHQNKICT